MLQEVESEDGPGGRTPPPLSPKSNVPPTPVTIPQVQLRSVAPKPAPPPVAQAATHVSPATQGVPAPIQAPAAPPVAAQQPGSGGGAAAGNPNVCAECERLIVGVFVRIKDKNLHVECFKCNTCGQSLKNIGYYNINNKLYCDVHAKTVARQNPPAPGLEPVTGSPSSVPLAPLSTPSGAPSAYAPVTPPKPFSLTSGIRPTSPNVDSYAAKIAPLPFHVRYWSMVLLPHYSYHSCDLILSLNSNHLLAELVM